MIPRPQISTAPVWPERLIISGAKYSGVPQSVLRTLCGAGAWTAQPKSAILSDPSSANNMFSGWIDNKHSTLCQAKAISRVKVSERQCTHLDVSVDNVTGVHVFECVCNLRHVSPGVAFGEVAMDAKLLEELTRATILQ